MKALWAAARCVEIDAGVRLPSFLCTSPGRLSELAVLEHDFHRPPDWTQEQRDATFWRSVRWALTGPGTG